MISPDIQALMQKAWLSYRAAEALSRDGFMDAQYHRWLLEAQDARNLGDYGAGLSLLQGEDVQLVLKHAELFLQAADNYLKRA